MSSLLLSTIIYLLPITLIVVLSILLYTIFHARQVVKRRHQQQQQTNDFEDSVNEDNSNKNNPNESIQEELDSNYSFISEEYKSKCFEKDIKLSREGRCTRRSRSGSQAAVQTMLHLMAGKQKNCDIDDEMDVNDAVKTFEGIIDPSEQVRSNSFPTISMRKRSSRLWSLQSLPEYSNSHKDQ